MTVNVGSTTCTVTLDASGTGTCTIGNTALAVGGPYAVSASYAGDSNLQGSTGTTSGVIVGGLNVTGTYTVSFQANGGTGTMGSETFTAGTAQALTTDRKSVV